MQRYLSRNLLSIATACGLLAGLAACAPPPTHLTMRLDAVPTPAPALMARTAVPDCRVRAAPASASPKEKLEAAAEKNASDFEGESANPETPPPEKEAQTVPEPRENELRRLARERDCYRKAERLARKQLDALQASSAQTVLALDRIREEVPGPGEQTGW